MPMYQTRRGTAAGAAGAVLLIAVATAGCGRQSRLVEGADATPVPPAVSTPIAVQPASPSVDSAPPEPASTTPATPTASATPVPTPDLAGIQDLLDQLGSDLGADASASTSEGSPQ